jgi:twitching motility protein PilT
MRQALEDALREDPDVLVVGEMREPETMRLTLNAAETGHLVFATIHSGTCVEALARIVSAFPSEIQSSVAAQLADCLEAVVCQRLRFHKDLGIRIPECEILRSTPAVKSDIRRGGFPQITSALETGADNGMWTFDRYGKWVAARSDWYVPSHEPQGTTAEPSAS